MKKQENRKKYREKKNKKGANAVEGNGTERKMMLGVRTAEGRGGEEGKTLTTKLSFVTQIPAWSIVATIVNKIVKVGLIIAANYLSIARYTRLLFTG